MIKESRYIVILQAAQVEDPSVAGEMNAEERESYDNNVKWFKEMRAKGIDVDHMDIDIPFSYDD